MKKFLNVVVLLVILGGVISTTTVASAAEADSQTPWFIGADSFEGAEQTDPSTYNADEVFGKTYELEGKGISNLSTAAEVGFIRKLNTITVMIPSFIVLMVGIAVYYKRKKIVNEKKTNDKKLELEERRIILEEKRFQQGESESTQGKSVSDSSTQSFPTDSGSFCLGKSIMENVSASTCDTNGDGTIDSFDIPTFML